MKFHLAHIHHTLTREQLIIPQLELGSEHSKVMGEATTLLLYIFPRVYFFKFTVSPYTDDICGLVVWYVRFLPDCRGSAA